MRRFGEAGEATAPVGGATGGAVPGKRSLIDEAFAPAASAGPAGPVVQRKTASTADVVERGVAADPDAAHRPGAFPLPATARPSQRHAAAAARLALVQQSVTNEDTTTARSAEVPKNDTPGHERVTTQLHARFPNVESDATAAQGRSADAVASHDDATAAPAVTAFETAVRAFQDAYESTYLASTDAPRTTRWSADADRDTLTGPKVADKLKRWSKGGALVKFAIPTSAPDEVRVGSDHYFHVDIAGGPVRTAGFLRFDTDASPVTVSSVENKSGGFRPGPLRNALVLERLIALGFVHDDLAGTEVHHNPDGNYH